LKRLFYVNFMIDDLGGQVGFVGFKFTILVISTFSRSGDFFR
jgi:hypothetical protein